MERETLAEDGVGNAVDIAEVTGDTEPAKHEGEKVFTPPNAAVEEGAAAQKVAGEEGSATQEKNAIVVEGDEKLQGEHVEGEQAEGEQAKGEKAEGEHAGEYVEGGEHVEGEYEEGEHAKGEHAEGEHAEGEHAEAEHADGEHAEAEHAEREETEGEHRRGGEEVLGEEIEGEGGVEIGIEEKKDEIKATEEIVEEEEALVEEPPPDPTAPFNFSDSKEALKEPFELRPEQLAEVELLWENYQNYTPAYTDIDNYITTKELVYLLKSLFLMTVTEEQFYELIEYCVRPPHPKGHINFDQFVKMVTLRQRDFLIEDELRSALQVFDPEKTGSVDRDNLREVLAKHGNRMPQRQLDNLIKEVDMANDGTLGIEDIIGTMCIDLNKDDLMMLREAVYPSEAPPPPLDDDD